MNDIQPTTQAPEADARRNPGAGRFERIDPARALRPGEYWRARAPVQFTWPSPNDDDIMRVTYEAEAGEVLVIAEIRKDGENDHAVDVLPHPLKPCRHRPLRMLVDDFLDAFEHAPDGEAVRARELETLNIEIRSIQAEIEHAQANPAYLNAQALKAIALRDTEPAEDGEDGHGGQDSPARPSPPARLGDVTVLNVLSVETPSLLQSMETLKPGDVPAAIEMVRSAQALAQAHAEWFRERTGEMSRRTQLVAGFYGERAEVGIARCSSMVARSKTLLESLSTMTLFTGEGVSTQVLLEGDPAAAGTPVRLFQRKLWADEEASFWCEYACDMRIDATRKAAFVDLMREHRGLVDQLIPAPRGAVLMGWSRRRDHAEDPLINEFLVRASCSSWILLRDGGRLMMVSSPVTSHAEAERLFPETDVDGSVFGGVDGHRVTAEDLRYSDRLDDLHLLAVHYRRFAVMLAGLVSREMIWPDIDFRHLFHARSQAKVFEMVFDDSGEGLLSDGRESLKDYLRRVNSDLRSGVRVVVDLRIAAENDDAVPGAWRHSGSQPSREYVPCEPFMVGTLLREGDDLFVRAAFSKRYREDATRTLKVYIARRGSPVLGSDAFLCFDALDEERLDRYMRSRADRAGFLGYMPLFKAAKRALAQAKLDEGPLRAWICAGLVDGGLCRADEAGAAVDLALLAWRATGAPMPEVGGEGAKALLNHVFNVTRAGRIDAEECETAARKAGLVPLRMSADRRGRILLYTEPSSRDDAGFRQIEVDRWVATRGARGVRFGAKLHAILSSLAPDETVLHEWPEAEPYLHKGQVELDLGAKRRLMRGIEEGIQIGRRLIAGPILDPDQAVRWFEHGFVTQCRGSNLVTYPDISVPIALVESRSGKAYVLWARIDAMAALQRNLPKAHADALARWWVCKFARPQNGQAHVEQCRESTELSPTFYLQRARDARVGTHPIERADIGRQAHLNDPENYWGAPASLGNMHRAFSPAGDGTLEGFRGSCVGIRRYWTPLRIDPAEPGALMRWLLSAPVTEPNEAPSV